MPGTQHDRFSYIRAAREVIPTAELEKFLWRVFDIGTRLGDKDSTTVRKQVSIDEELAPGYEPQIRGVGIPALTLYRPNGLRSTLFELRRGRSPRDNNYLTRLSRRLMNLDLASVDSASPELPLTVTGRYLIESTRPEHGKSIREFGIVLDDGPTQSRLIAENQALYREAGRRVGSTAAESIPPEAISDPTVIPILTLPVQTNGKMVQDFVEQVNEDAFDPQIKLSFEEPEWVIKLR